MSHDAKTRDRRSFLALAGAPFGAAAVDRDPADPAELGQPSRTGGSPSPRPGTVTGFSARHLEVDLGDAAGTSHLVPEDFGDWQYTVGDRVLVVEGSTGEPVAKPLVRTVDAPVPGKADRLQLGDMIRLAGIRARVTSPSVRQAITELADSAGRSPVHWLLSENSVTGEHRVFGVVAGR